MKTGCAKLVIDACTTRECSRVVHEAARRAGATLVEAPAWAREPPIRLSLVLEAVSRGTPPEAILVVVDAPVLDADEVRRETGLVKLLDASGCTMDELVETIRSVSCKGGLAPCPVDVGLGWLQV